MTLDLGDLKGRYFPVAIPLQDGRFLLLPRFSENIEDKFLAVYPKNSQINPIEFSRLFLENFGRIQTSEIDTNQKKIDDEIYEGGLPISGKDIDDLGEEFLEFTISSYLERYVHLLLPSGGRGKNPKDAVLLKKVEGETACARFKFLADELFSRTEVSVKQSIANLDVVGKHKQAASWKEKDPRSRNVKMDLMMSDPVAQSVANASGFISNIGSSSSLESLVNSVGRTGDISSMAKAVIDRDNQIYNRPEVFAPPRNPGLEALQKIQKEVAEQRRVQHAQEQSLLQMLDETRNQSQQLDALAAALRILTEQTRRHEELFSGLLSEAKDSSKEASRNSLVAVISLLVSAILSGASLWVSFESKTDDYLSELIKVTTEQSKNLKELRKDDNPPAVVEDAKPSDPAPPSPPVEPGPAPEPKAEP